MLTLRLGNLNSFILSKISQINPNKLYLSATLLTVYLGLSAQNENYLHLYSDETVICTISTSHDINLSVVGSEIFISQDEKIYSFGLNEVTKYAFSSNSNVTNISFDKGTYYINGTKLYLSNLTDETIIGIFSINGNLLYKAAVLSIEDRTIDLASFRTNFLVIKIGESTFKAVLR